MARPAGRGAAAGQGQPTYDVVSAPREITIFDLLTHTSGLVSGGPGASAAPQRAATDTLASYIPRLGAVPLDFQPGSLWRYSGSAGFDVLSRIVESPQGSHSIGSSGSASSILSA
jgi:CubicO group peptidase (beta-lactamase class C family)